MEKPKVIFLDAVGTLIGIRGSVGKVYSTLANQAGVEVSASLLDQTFPESFKTAQPPTFSSVERQQICQLEFQWWEAIAKSTFERAGVFHQFADFSPFFKKLYDYFATEKPWYVYPDVLPALLGWRLQGIELGIISNFDTRLYQVIERLQLQDFFSSITISSLAGAAKPECVIFLAALEQHSCSPEQAWHIGDSLEDDYYGAKAVGIQAFLLKRGEKGIGRGEAGVDA